MHFPIRFYFFRLLVHIPWGLDNRKDRCFRFLLYVCSSEAHLGNPLCMLVAELRAACQLNANPGAKPKSGGTKTDLIYKRAFCNYL